MFESELFAGPLYYDPAVGGYCIGPTGDLGIAWVLCPSMPHLPDPLVPNEDRMPIDAAKLESLIAEREALLREIESLDNQRDAIDDRITLVNERGWKLRQEINEIIGFDNA